MSTPTLRRDHDEYEQLAVAWAVNALEPADQAIFEAHRDECDRCTEAALAALDIAAELAYGMPDVALPARLRERVLATALPHGPAGQAGGRPGRSDVLPVGQPAFRNEANRSEGRPVAAPVSGGDLGRSGDRRGGGPAAGGEARRRPNARPARMARAMQVPGRMARAMRGSRRLMCALAAAVLVAASAVTMWEITRPAPAMDRIAALSAGSGTVATVAAHQHGADVVTDMLPPNSGRGTAYYIWGVPAEDSGTAQVVGTFEVTTTGLHSYPLRLTRSLDGFPLLAISEEKAGSRPSAPSGVLGKGVLGKG